MYNLPSIFLWFVLSWILIYISNNLYSILRPETMCSVFDSGTRDGAHMCSIAMVSGDIPWRVQINNLQPPYQLVPITLSVGSYQLGFLNPHFISTTWIHFIITLSAGHIFDGYICTLIFRFSFKPLFYHKACRSRLLIPWHHRTCALTCGQN
jgi:hypothetical protein